MDRRRVRQGRGKKRGRERERETERDKERERKRERKREREATTNVDPGQRLVVVHVLVRELLYVLESRELSATHLENRTFDKCL